MQKTKRYQQKTQQKQHINFLAAIFKSLIISTSWFTIFLKGKQFFLNSGAKTVFLQGIFPMLRVIPKPRGQERGKEGGTTKRSEELLAEFSSFSKRHAEK